jgi:exosortase/archaeosortase family protein
MTALTLYRAPTLIRAAAWIQLCPAWVWIALAAAALWPSWQWGFARMTDGSDDPLGVAAIAVVALMLWLDRKVMRLTPVWHWLAIAAAGVVAAALLATHVPPLAIAVIAALALTAAIAAFVPSHRPVLPLAGLLVLALPVISSLQFYAGFPLRLLTAEASKILLKLMGYAAERAGSAMIVDGKLIIVDAPCSGVQMVWLAYFTACTVAVLGRLPARSFMLRLPLVGLLVLAGNVVRNTLLVMCEVDAQSWPTWSHDAVGLAVLAAVCSAVAVLMSPHRRASSRDSAYSEGYMV